MFPLANCNLFGAVESWHICILKGVKLRFTNCFYCPALWLIYIATLGIKEWVLVQLSSQHHSVERLVRHLFQDYPLQLICFLLINCRLLCRPLWSSWILTCLYLERRKIEIHKLLLLPCPLAYLYCHAWYKGMGSSTA